MSLPEELTFEKILQFMLDNGGRVTNHELVKHFKVHLTDPANRAEARETFKRHVNTLASIKNQNNEKWLILKRKYITPNEDIPEPPGDIESDDMDKTPTPLSPQCQPFNESFRSPPPYKPPPEFSSRPLPTPPAEVLTAPTFPNLDITQVPRPAANIFPPMVDCDELGPPRNKIEDKENLPQHSLAVKPAIPVELSEIPKELCRSVSVQENIHMQENIVQLRRGSSSVLEEKEQALVKERKKIFTRNDGEGDAPKPRPMSTRKTSNRVDVQKRSSGMHHLDPKGHEWIVRASAADYATLAKMCENNPKLVKIKDPITGYTALHWAAKKGEEQLVKLLASIAPATVHEKTNGGYTPLHIAMQFRHENVYKLLIDVFDGDPNVTDYSGRKPRQYPVSLESWSPIKKTTKKQSDMGFLRIGSLNLRVKKTTSAVNNFLGLGVSRAPGSYRTSSPKYRADLPGGNAQEEHEHLKSWGSADNIPDNKTMPPPTAQRVKRRGSRSGRDVRDAQSRSTPSTPNQPRALLSHAEDSHDSDSDSAAGFHADWRAKRNSHI